MLSALAKYIFGGVMGDAPETTPLQYETREMNDWLLVDMPDQAIDDEDMDSESDEDDILTAIPLLLTDDLYPTQIVLSCDANSACDNSYGKIRKDFRGKIHSASPKVQLHSGDRAQGNFVDNIEDNFHGKHFNDSLKVQESSKSKKSRSKKSKSKRPKKNRHQDKFEVKTRDISVAVKEGGKECVQENSTDLMHLVSTENLNNFVDDKGGMPSYETVGDTATTIQVNAREQEKEICNNILEKRCDKNIDTTTITCNSDIKCQTVSSANQNILIGESCFMDVPEASSSFLDKEVGSDILSTDVQGCLDEINKNNDFEQNISKDEVKVPLLSNIQAYYSGLGKNSKKFKGKKNRSQKSKKSRMQNKFDTFFQDTSFEVTGNSKDSLHENFNGNVRENLDKNKLFSSKMQDNSDDDVQDRLVEDLSDAALEMPNDRSENAGGNNHIKCAKVEQNCEAQVHFEKENESASSKIKQDSCDTAHQNFTEKVEVISNHTLEDSNEKTENSSRVGIQGNKVSILEESYCKFQSNPIVQQEDEIYPISSKVQKCTYNENECNFVDNFEIYATEIENFHNENKKSAEFQENSNDQILDNFADFWDIYTKIQENSDDEMNDGNFKDVSDDDLDVTDDEMQENSDYENRETSDDELFERPRGKILEILYGENKSKLYHSAYQFDSDEENEDELYNEMFINIQNHTTLPLIERCTPESKPDFTQLVRSYCSMFEELNQKDQQVANYHTACVPYTAYELAEYFNFEPGCFYASQSLHYPSSYALAIAEFYARREQYFQQCQKYPSYSECSNVFTQKCKKRPAVEKSSPLSSEPSLITNSAELLQNIINQKFSVLPPKTAVVLEHVKDLKPVQQAIQFESRKYLTRSHLNRQNRNYIYQSSVKTNRRRNLLRNNNSGANNNRKCY